MKSNERGRGKKGTVTSNFLYNEPSSSARLAPNDVVNLPTFKINLGFSLSFAFAYSDVSLDFPGTGLSLDFDYVERLRDARRRKVRGKTRKSLYYRGTGAIECTMARGEVVEAAPQLSAMNAILTQNASMHKMQ